MHVVEKSSKTPTSSSKVFNMRNKFKQISQTSNRLKPEVRVKSKSFSLLRTSLNCGAVPPALSFKEILNLLWTLSSFSGPTPISQVTISISQKSTTKSSPQTASWKSPHQTWPNNCVSIAPMMSSVRNYSFMRSTVHKMKQWLLRESSLSNSLRNT